MSNKWDIRYEKKKSLIKKFINYKEMGKTEVLEDMSNFQKVEVCILNARSNLNILSSEVYKLEKETEEEKWDLVNELREDHPNEIIDLRNPPQWLFTDKRWQQINSFLKDLDHLQDLIEDVKIIIKDRSYELDRLLKYHKYKSDQIFG